MQVEEPSPKLASLKLVKAFKAEFDYDSRKGVGARDREPPSLEDAREPRRSQAMNEMELEREQISQPQRPAPLTALVNAQLHLHSSVTTHVVPKPRRTQT